jgi:4-amino-4-deoxy-L-arabinose transferase-like glycosyltransferase
MSSAELHRESSSTSGHRTLTQALRAFFDEYGMVSAVLIAVASHAINMLNYPLYLGDEGIYLEQAWSVLRQGQLAPYTYFYDHAPAGWLMIALWEFLLPTHFFTLGMAINSARVLMLLLDAASVALLYRVALRMTNSHLGAVASALVFTLSPLDIYYQRMVLLDNVMVFWLLLTLDLLLTPSRRLMTVIASGFAFGMAVLCKENALFFAPVVGYLLYQRVRDSYRTRFSIVGWTLCAIMLISLYPVYALLKGEFFPATSSLIGNGAPAAHVSLVSTTLWQAGRHGGSILDPNSQFWQYFWGKWWNKDPLIIIIGVGATVVNFLIGWRDRERRLYAYVASLLSAFFTVYLVRGSIMIDFYVVPVLPFFSLNVGMVLARLASLRPHPYGFVLAVVALLGIIGWFGTELHDEFFVNQTEMQIHQLRFVQQTIPSDAKILMDDDLWVDLHEPRGNAPAYEHAHSHWKIAADPAIRDTILDNRWQNIDYMIMSNQLHYIFELNNEQLALDAYDHSQLLARFQEGDVSLEVRRVIKDNPSS